MGESHTLVGKTRIPAGAWGKSSELHTEERRVSGRRESKQRASLGVNGRQSSTGGSEESWYPGLAHKMTERNEPQ